MSIVGGRHEDPAGDRRQFTETRHDETWRPEEYGC